LQDNGLSLEYNEKNGIFEQDSYRMALFKVRCGASFAVKCCRAVAPDHANRKVQRCTYNVCFSCRCCLARSKHSMTGAAAQ
jgi:hypothetical protein